MDDCPNPFKNCNFLLAGNNCTIEIFPTKQPVHNLGIQFSDYVHNAIVRIGKSFGCQSANIIKMTMVIMFILVKTVCFRGEFK